MALAPQPGELSTEAVEEFISIADGQVRARVRCGRRFACAVVLAPHRPRDVSCQGRQAASSSPGRLVAALLPRARLLSQLVLEPLAGAAGGSGGSSPPPSRVPYRANPKLSITRVGARAYPRALEVLAPQIRLSLAQAEDARK